MGNDAGTAQATSTIFISSTGNVGIGTTGPNARLSFGLDDVTKNFYAYEDGTDVYGVGKKGSTGLLQIFAGAASDNNRVGIGKYDGTTFTERLTVLNGGNVGIGTTGPTSKLHVVGSGGFGIDTYDIRIRDNGRVYVGGTGVADAKGSFYNNAGIPTFADYTSGSWLDSISLKAGNVGIGTTVPDSKLSVRGTATQLNLQYDGSNYQTFTILSDGALNIAQDGAAAAFAIKSGNVGIGTTNPQGKLHVLGSCVTGDTLLPIRRRRRKKSSNENNDEELWDYFLCRIDEVLPGDEVLSLNEATESLRYARINKLMDMGMQEVYELTTKSGRKIQTTGEHPYLTLQK